MTFDSVNLLKRLGPPVTSAAPQELRTPLEMMRFGELLAMASSGGVRSGREVNVAFDPEPALDPGQLERIAAAADLAEGAGSRSAVLLVDGRALLIDVAERTLTGELTPSTPLQRVDAAVQATAPVRVSRPLIPGTGLSWNERGGAAD